MVMDPFFRPFFRSPKKPEKSAQDPKWSPQEPKIEPKWSQNGAKIDTFLETVDPYKTCTGMVGSHVHPPWGSTLFAHFCDSGPGPSKNRSKHANLRTRCQNVSKTGPKGVRLCSRFRPCGAPGGSPGPFSNSDAKMEPKLSQN